MKKLILLIMLIAVASFAKTKKEILLQESSNEIILDTLTVDIVTADTLNTLYIYNEEDDTDNIYYFKNDTLVRHTLMYNNITYVDFLNIIIVLSEIYDKPVKGDYPPYIGLVFLESILILYDVRDNTLGIITMYPEKYIAIMKLKEKDPKRFARLENELDGLSEQEVHELMKKRE